MHFRCRWKGARQQEESEAARSPPELQALWQQRIAIIERQIRRLQSLLGDEGFHKLDSYIRANFVPVVVEPGQGTAEGGVQ